MIPIEEVIKAVLCEAYKRKYLVFLIFSVVSLSLLLVGATWPKQYSAFSIIQADDTNILQSLMRGTAESTETVDHAANAREIIFGEKIMSEIIKEPVWQDKITDGLTDIQEERIKRYIRSNISINNIGEDLLKIVYVDTDPKRAYVTSKRITELFIYEGGESKTKESKAAYDFINKQVKEYLSKLTKVEDDLREFKKSNPNSRPGLEEEISRRITSLENTIEQTRLELHEALIRRNSIKKQLSGEAAITISKTRENQYRTKISELQSQLDSLRLDYKETYPDIVRIKHQITALKNSLNEEIQRREHLPLNSGQHERLVDDSIIINPLYNELRSEAASTEIEISTLRARIADVKKTLDKEYERAKKIHEGEAALSKLTRDYQVNQEIYQDLLRRRERARVSKSIDQEQQGLNYEIQEPAKLPLIPTGLRFLHFTIGGIILGLAIPFVLIFALIQIDPRIRFSQIISSEQNVPVLTEIAEISSQSEQKSDLMNVRFITFGIIVVMLVFVYVIWLKNTGVLS